MKIIEIKVLRGPNYWSIRRPKLIQMKIDLGEMELLPTNKINGFKENLEKLLPTLYEHRCSEGQRLAAFCPALKKERGWVMLLNMLPWSCKPSLAWIWVLGEQEVQANLENILSFLTIWKKKQACLPQNLRSTWFSL